MADRWETYSLEFRGGLITNLSPLQQGINLPGSARQLRNFEPSVEGGYRRIEGFVKYDSAPVPQTGVIRGVYTYAGQALAARGTGLYRSFGNGWTTLTTSLANTTNKVRFAKYRFTGTEKIYILDQTSKPFIYDGSTVTLLSSLPNEMAGCEHVAVFKNNIAVSKGNLVYISAAFADDDFSFASGGIVNTFNDTVTGLVVFREQLFVFTRSSISKIVGSTASDIVIQPVSIDLGCVEPDTIQEIGGDVMFLGPDGLRLLSGTERIGDVGLGAVSRNIQTEVTELVSNNSIFCSLVVRKKSQYRIFGYATSTSLDNSKGIIGVQFAQQGGEGIAWSETRGIKAFTAHSEYINGDELILFGNAEGYLYRMEQGNTFDGADISSTFFTPYLPINDVTLRKTFYTANIYLDPTGSFTTNLNLNYDFGTAQVIPDSVTITNNTTTGESEDQPVGLYGTASYATFTTTASALVNGAVTDATTIAIDNVSGTIQEGDFLSGDEIINSPVVVSVADPNTITIDIAQTLTDNASINFSDHSVLSSGFIYGDAIKLTFRTQVTGSGFVVSVEFVSDSSVQPFSLDALALEYATHGRR